MRRRRVGLFLAATGAVATMSLSAPPAFAGQGQGRPGSEGTGTTIEEFVCFRDTGNRIRLGTGKVITTPSGNVRGVCTAKPFEPGPVAA